MRYFSSNAIPADLGEVRWLYETVDVDLEGIVGRLRGRFGGTCWVHIVPGGVYA